MSEEIEVELDEGLDELIDELPQFEDEADTSFLGRVKTVRQTLMAGADTGAPKPGDPQPLDPNDPFLASLTPLGQAEIISLSRETANDPTVFQTFEKQVNRVHYRNQFSAAIAGAALIGFGLMVGPEYLTDTLTNPSALPSWVPDIPTDPKSASLFILGLIVPLFAAIALMTACKALFTATALKQPLYLILAAPAFIASMYGLALCMDAEFFKAFLLVTGYGVYSWVVRKALYRRG